MKHFCDFCNTKMNKIYLKKCSYCDKKYCISHYSPDIHQCIYTTMFFDQKKNEFIQQEKEKILTKDKVQKI